ncbi:glycoside hydrolase family 2 protein [Halorhabdus sp. CBA1104]|uniref:beta-mannosidase n=1 Tax=Halorhabdus sp. CBA1104 TaxID=1380432 RepID=UPI0012B3F95A|nr:glycoside hydrolase family 2 protein [Halorhabdus sp. CBA1104]QGN07028.1 glycoside hydrolase family 2 protein [Halorhabdus sp. CBA1104]
MKTHSLNGSWQCRQRPHGDWFEGTVPGGVYTDLVAAGEIPDPYDEDNELDLQWVGKTDWEYRREFEIDETLVEQDRVTLRCEGVDTVATICINETDIGETSNMHRIYEFDVTDALEIGTNEISVVFDSPVEYAIEQRDAYSHEVPVTQYPVEQPARNFIRKAQCHYGWDWGPCLPTVGIYRDIELIGHAEPRITYVKPQQDHDGNGVELTAVVGVDSPTNGEYAVTVSIAGSETTERREIAAGESELAVSVTVDDPERWWPRGYGDQPLYDCTVAIDGADSATTRVGFRDISVVREVDGENAESFSFEVNGVAVFAKGANWIPIDAMYGGVSTDRYDQLLESAAEANMNTIRIWGGGYYENDYFYERCDELGLLVWQDFMFACSLYPADDTFVENVTGEVRDQVRRLASHPSIALWCGNNENEWGLEHGWYGDRTDSEVLFDEYDRLFESALADVVAEEDPTRRYWPSSPSSGIEATDPQNPAKGDIHYWDVWHGGKPFADYLTVEPRFVSEFGYQSFPSIELLETVVPEESLNPTDPLMEHHQRHPDGNGLILARMADHFRIPFDFADFVYLSQLQQGFAIKTAVEHWRRLKPYSMGAIFWQLNDLWPVASWSSIEYGGGWKALQYMAKRFFEDVLVSFHDDPDEESLELWVTSDVTDSIEGTVELDAIAFDGGVLASRSIDVTLDELESKRVATVSPAFADVPTESYLLRATLSADDYTGRNTAFFEPFKHLDLPGADVDVTVEGDTVTLESDDAALFVALSAPALAGHFSDNYVHLTPGETRTVSFTGEADGDELASTLGVTHLEDTY